MTEAVGIDTSTDINTNTTDQTSEITSLREQLNAATERINQYDGERKDYSEQTNQIEDLKSQVEGLKQTVQDADDEDSKHEIVTKEELRDFKASEGERFAEYSKVEAQKVIDKQMEYQKHLANASLKVKDEAEFNEIIKEHDSLITNGGMPEETGNLKADAEIAWREAENSLLRKKNALGQKLDFKTVDDVKKPIVPGQQELSSNNTTAQKTSMPDNLPDDAKEFVALMGMGSDSVNRGLKR